MPVHFKSYAGTVSVPFTDEATVAELARDAGLNLNLYCGGKGSCRRCRVYLEQGVFRVGGQTRTLQGDLAEEALACQTVVLSEEARIRVPLFSLVEEEGKIDDDFIILSMPDASDTSPQEGLGAAVDIGTTTVVAALIDRKDGAFIRKASKYNAQIERADDVASRISLCETPEGLEDMRRLCIDKTLIPLLEELCEAGHRCLANIRHVVLSGNTVMLHLALGLSPISIGRIPFEPQKKVFERVPARSIGLSMLDDAEVDCIPCTAGYIGGDIVADLMVSGLASQPGVNLLIDIGTNGEMVLAEDGRLTACATAAGPAFEGAGLRHGCRAARGAVEHLEFDQRLDFHVQVIGHTRPMGLCGSAIVDFMACGLRSGMISPLGRYDLDLLKSRGRYAVMEDDGRPSHACVITAKEESGVDEAIMVSEADIAQVIKAKAAIYAGARTLLELHGKQAGALNNVFLAGGFARHVNIHNAITIGLLPDLPENKFICMGNGSLAGAYLALMHDQVLPGMIALSRRPQITMLNNVPGFETSFIDALAMPYMDSSEFPSIHV